jgi:hypothetical protein
MRARCLRSFFSQDVSGTQEQIIEVKDQKTFDDLVKSGYIESLETQKDTAEGNVPRPTRNRKATGPNES